MTDRDFLVKHSDGPVSHWSSTIKGFSNIICAMAGVGVLGLPSTVAQAGWAALPMIVIMGLAALLTANLLIQCLYLDPNKHRLMNYMEIGRSCFGTPGYLLVQLMHKATLFAVSILYLVVIGGVMFGACEPLFGDNNLTASAWSVVAGLLLLPIVIGFRTIKEVAFLTIIGAAIIFAVIVVTVSTSGGHSAKGSKHELFHSSDFARAAAGIVTSFGGHALFPDVEDHLDDRTKMPQIFVAAFGYLIVVYLAMGITGYAAYGEVMLEGKFKGSILAVLGAYGVSDPVIQSLNFLLVGHLFMTIPMIMNVAIAEAENLSGCGEIQDRIMNEEGFEDSTKNLEDGLNGDSEEDPNIISSEAWNGIRPVVRRLIIRSTLMGMVTLFAGLIPDFLTMMDFIGACTVTTIVYVFPCVFYLKMKGDMAPIHTKITLCVIVVVALVTAVYSLVQTIQGLVNKKK